MDETCLNPEKSHPGRRPRRRRVRGKPPEIPGHILKSAGQKFRLKFDKRTAYISAGVIIALLVIVATFRVYANRPKFFAVKVDGEVIGQADDKDLVTKMVDRLSEEESFRVGAEVKVASEITYEQLKWDKDLVASDPDDLGQILKEKISFMASGYIICVDGEDVVALASEEEARGTLSDLRDNYVKNIIEPGHATCDEVLIKEKIDIVEKEVSTLVFRRRDEAEKILVRGTDKMLSYTVQRGDSLWTIAQANRMSVDDLRKANPEVKGDLIREGENLNLVVADPYVTLSSRETVTYTQSIPFSVQVTRDSSMWPWQEKVTQEGKSGEKEIVEQVIRENGKEVSRTKISERVISYPVAKKLIRGSKEVPAMGSGELVWPVQGTITSKFGWRWSSFHRGVDIGASSGTAIKAADSGVVTFTGWSGGYGNLVKINHGNMQTWYAHMSKIAVKTGDKVGQGDVIGYVGSTGISSGPHLHFEVHVEGVAKDPLSFYK
jgi:murein DD-endopeptidase MepM/ murein hydrolase activator NlpD